MRYWCRPCTCLPQSDLRIGVGNLCTLIREGALNMSLEVPRMLCPRMYKSTHLPYNIVFCVPDKTETSKSPYLLFHISKSS